MAISQRSHSYFIRRIHRNWLASSNVRTGCSHAGICNIIEYAKKVCGVNKVHGVIGGFHLFEKGERLTETIEYLKSQNISLLYPCHCVSLEAKIEMGKSLMIHECGVGLQLNAD